MSIRPMTQADLLQVAALEAAILPEPWSAGMFAEELALGSHCRIWEDASGAMLGYSVARLLVDEWHLLTLGIAPAHRRQGGARQLLTELMQRATLEGCRAILLEVRASNTVARSVYLDMGFQRLGTRKDYYRSEFGSEDALQLIFPLPDRDDDPSSSGR